MSRDCSEQQQNTNDIINPTAELVGSGWATISGTDWNADESKAAVVSDSGWGND